MKYLGVPLHFEKLRREDIQPIVDKPIVRIAGWRGRLLAYSSRLVLIKTCLASIPIYLLPFLKFPKWAISLINAQISHCLWNNGVQENNWHLENLESVCMQKEFGGLGIPDLRLLNVFLLNSWVKRYNIDDGKVWK
ncbi:hypothetical protein PR202_ga01678 [Eleusine coracana subsp. coracana]|uniref:Uncharacterized protein n=1 Tax=Eleusine coracana subsp. coracana TaxID=191504 RepID=A0AAV5BFP5_ELECO|nr:hypothetical protein PR202_ga00991 [Eleusine coracana subsp. coracana]GJM85871.1 hypothetical protein PR202_ga01678 [Eleusine coracana subsp. coracana]